MSPKHQQHTEAVPDEILAEGSGPHDEPAREPVGDAVAAGEALAGEAAPEPEPEGDEIAAAEGEVVEAGVAGAEVVEAEVAAAEAEVAGAEVVGIVPSSAAASLDDDALAHLIEAIIFAADKPVTMSRLRQLTRLSDARRLEQALDRLACDYADRGIALQHVSGGYQFRTNTTYSGWVQQLVAGRPVRLSRAQLETLAIIAYRQPITRPEIDEIRGVDSSATLRLLLDRSLIRVLGKREEVGRPILYGTTGEFLDFFSLQDLRELPTLREYSELTAESRQVVSDRLGVALDDDLPSAVPVPDSDSEISSPPPPADAEPE